ncbi:MAG: redoxin domain-containing protein [Saprospiraceae bacterium]
MKSQSLQIFETFDALETYIKESQETTYVINFWATWCGPCVKELPYFEEVNNKLKYRNVKVLLVSLDFLNQIDSHLIPFIKKSSIASEVWLMKDRKYDTWIEKVDPSWTGAIPATLVVKGESRVFKEGEFHSEEEIFKFLASYITN